MTLKMWKIEKNDSGDFVDTVFYEPGEYVAFGQFGDSGKSDKSGNSGEFDDSGASVEEGIMGLICCRGKFCV